MKKSTKKGKKKAITNSNKIVILILFVTIVYIIVHMFNLYKKLDSYNAEISYYESKIEELKKEQEELKEIQANVNSPEYIEQMARENLDMYYSNEKVYIDISK